MNRAVKMMPLQKPQRDKARPHSDNGTPVEPLPPLSKLYEARGIPSRG